MIDIEMLISKLKDYKEKVQNTLNEEDDLLLAVVLAVLKGLEEKQEDE